MKYEILIVTPEEKTVIGNINFDSTEEQQIIHKNYKVTVNK